MSADLKQQIALAALNRMMAGAHFDICAVRDVGDMLGLQARAHESYRLLAPLHCMNWGDMPTDVRNAVPGLIRDCLGVEPAYRFQSLAPATVTVVDIADAPAREQPSRSGLLRLLPTFHAKGTP